METSPTDALLAGLEAGAERDQPLKGVAGAVETLLYDDRVTTGRVRFAQIV